MPNPEERNEHREGDTPTFVNETTVETPLDTPDTPEEAPAEAPAAPAEEAPTEEAPTERASAPSFEERGEQSRSEEARPSFTHTDSPLRAAAMEDAKKEAARVQRMSRVRNTILAIVLAVSLLSVTLLGGFALGQMNTPGVSGGTTTTTTQNGGTGTGNQPEDGRGDLVLNVVERVEGTPTPGSIASVVASVKASVVEITTAETIVDPFNGNYVTGGAGSGVLISSDNAKGLILTCNHVIDGADAGGITVTLDDGRTFSGAQVELIGTDSWSDLALLQIRDTNGGEPANLTYATLATSGNASDYSYMSVGETVIAIGNPLGELGGSVSSGIISALGREVTVEGMPMTLLQTDTAVNPGNSGGGLFNMAGELIGIVNAKSTGDDIEGIGFAIPSSDAIPIVGSLYSQGYVSGRPFLGLYFTTASGYFVVSEYEYNDTLSGEYKLQSGDYLTHIDGQKVTSVEVIRSILAEKAVGDTVSMTFVRIMGYRQETFTLDLLIYEYTP